MIFGLLFDNCLAKHVLAFEVSFDSLIKQFIFSKQSIICQTMSLLVTSCGVDWGQSNPRIVYNNLIWDNNLWQILFILIVITILQPKSLRSLWNCYYRQYQLQIPCIIWKIYLFWPKQPCLANKHCIGQLIGFGQIIDFWKIKYLVLMFWLFSSIGRSLAEKFLCPAVEFRTPH